MRRFILWSSHPPFIYLYEIAYKSIVWLAVFILRRYRGVISIYICRGVAKNEIIPGISDIDLFLVTTNCSKDRKSIKQAFRALGVATGGMIDYHPNLVVSLESLEHRWNTSAVWQYRYQEGKSTWKLLYGQDVLKSLPDLSESQRLRSCFAEINHWCIRFADFILKPGGFYQDTVMRNMICFKAVSEVMNARHSMLTGEYIYSRPDGLRRSDNNLAEKLSYIVERKFLVTDDQLVEEVYVFLLRFFRDIWLDFSNESFLLGDPDVLQETDSAESEFQISEKASGHLNLLQNHIERFWKGKFRAIKLVKSAFWDLDDFLFIIDAEESHLPNVKNLVELVDLHNSNQEGKDFRIFLFLRLGPILFPLTPVIPRDFHRSILTPSTVPDIFLQLGEEQVFWTDHTSWYLADWKSNEQWLSASALKAKQLDCISSSIGTGRVIYPLTPEAVERAEQKAGSAPGDNTSPPAHLPGARKKQKELFSVKRILSNQDESGESLYRCLSEARRFIDTMPVSDIIDCLFEERQNCRLLLNSILDVIHVGFIFPGRNMSSDVMTEESIRAGFCSGHERISSVAISRELSEISEGSPVRADIFIARMGEMKRTSGYAEVFIPMTDAYKVRDWMEKEIGTHIGLTMSNPLMYRKVQGAFKAEGFQVPGFMMDRPITIPNRKLEIAYFEKNHGDGKIRIEVLNFPGGNQ